MQRIGRPENYELNSVDLNAKIQILHNYFPPSIANVFAIPKSKNGGMEWWTELEGKATAYQDLPVHEQHRLLQSLNQRLDGIKNLAAKLAADGRQTEAQALQSLLGAPDTMNLWSINGEPLLTSWAKPIPAPAAAPSVVQAAPPVTAIPTEKTTKKRRWGLWLLPLLLLLLLALAYWLWWRKPVVDVPAAAAAQESLPFQCRKNAVPPDFVMVIDTSGSMDLNINISDADETIFLTPMAARTMPRAWQQAAVAEPKRMSIAKSALKSVVQDLHPSITTDVITFGMCDQHRKQTFHKGKFTGEQRPDLLRLIQSLPADQATPIAESMRHAARLVDGKHRDAMVVMLVDGEDGCGENVCNVARELHAQKPRMRINVVNISDKPMSNCIAEQTGGRVYAAKDAQMLAKHLADATNEVLNREDCSER